MACQATRSWTLSSLVGAYLDLAIAYFLLCASSLAFLAAKFLSFFGLHLPCPCNGLFCLHTVLIEDPIKKISAVQASCKTRFPIDSILMDDPRPQRLSLKLLTEGDEGEDEDASCSSNSTKLARFGSSGRRPSDEVRGRCAVNPRLRRRRRGAVDGRRISRESSQSPFGSRREIMDDNASSVQFDSGRELSQHEKEASVGIQSDGSIQHSFQWNDFLGESSNLERNPSSVSDIIRSVQHDMGSDVNAIRVLEHALEEEHAARAALYQELEKERSAAASAADEAMAMILRLQKEKAATEMEARQYQRMIEEKSTYDAEEMSILKEILLRREKEKHFLEKEVEAYKQMLACGSERSSGMTTPKPRTMESSEDPTVMLQEISAYIDKKEMVKSMDLSSDYDAARVLSFREESPSPCWPETDDLSTQEEANENRYPNASNRLDESEQEFREKKLQSMEGDSVVREEGDSLEKTIVVDDQLCENETRFPSDNADLHSRVEGEPTLLDVHVIDDKEEATERSTNPNIQSEPSSLRSGLPSTSRAGTPPLVRRSISDIRNVQEKDLLSDMRRYSMSSVNIERLKLENEVGWLRGRLKLVQEGREKLSFSVEHREREKLHLQLLEDIARQLRDIRQLTEPGNVRQAALPPPSKVSSKKRRCRSATLHIHGSS